MLLREVLARRDCGPTEFQYVQDILEHALWTMELLNNSIEMSDWIMAHKHAINVWADDKRRARSLR